MIIHDDFGFLLPESQLQLQVKELEIEVLIGQTELYARQTIQKAIETGRKLIEVREVFRHNKNGGFSGWWESRFKKSKQTAYNYINIAERFNSQTVGRLDFDLSALHLLAAPSVPESAREEAIKRAESGETITKDVAKEILDYQKEKDRLTEEAGRVIKIVAHDFVNICSLLWDAHERLGHEIYVKWISVCWGASEDMGKRMLQAYEQYKDNLQLVEDSASNILNTYSDDLLTFVGFGEDCKGYSNSQRD